ncbi:RES family NAD+ phosphorylase [Phreatobacter sp.]|uniref:RES family NAD+ phosphorylase n=1 Tax=Phreatobacter sp. TaxID=1966341 RepID=UPI003F6FFD32
MAPVRRRRDNTLIDAIEAHRPARFEGTVWRVVREGRSPIDCARSGGRWDDGTFDVLYTAAERDGAVAEMFFHLGRGQPVFPSQVRYELHELSVALERALRLVDLAALAALGLDTAKYGQLSYEARNDEYPRSQDIAEVAHFLEFDGLIVPNARWACSNVILFCDRVPPTAMEAVHNHGLVDWAGWAKRHNR